ncbi:MAG: T9SS type A sorting domain-containing protein [Flavobacteriaceae bacterium]|nr:T9SS type A sorting domain-containing protein [Flavobacteriaceae bacterium]
MKKLYTLLLLISFSVTAQMPVNLLTNGDFEANNAATVWTGNVEIRNDNPGSGQADDNFYFFADVATAGDSWNVNLSQAVTLTQGNTYTLSFEASTGTANTRTIKAGIGQNAEPYGSATETITLTDTNETITHDFVAGFAGPHRVLFDMGADAGIVVIDNVSLVEKDVSSGTGAPNNLLLEDFSGSPNTEAFESLTSATIEADPATGGTNGSALKLITNPGGNGWQGATIKFAAGSYANISTNKTIAVDVHATSAISIMAKVEDESFSSPAAANTQTHTGLGWETLIFTFTSGSDGTTTANGTYTKVSIFPNRKADDTGWNDPVVDQTIYIDNIKSTEAAPQHQNGLQDGDETGVDCGGTVAPACPVVVTGPTDAPATPPVRNAADVISVYGEAYGTAVGLKNTTWDKSTFADETIAGNVVLKVELSDGDYIGADLAQKIDATSMTHFHIDYWLAGDLLTGQTMNSKWSNHAGGNVETSSFQDYNAAPEVGSWKSRDIDITALTVNTSRDELAQLIISLAATGGTYPSTIYIDNVYFYKEATASIDDIKINVNVYPNPVKDILNVISAESIDAVRIFDLTGRVVKQATPNKENFDLDVADLSNGVYLVKLNAGNKEVSTKLIKQ